MNSLAIAVVSICILFALARFILAVIIKKLRRRKVIKKLHGQKVFDLQSELPLGLITSIAPEHRSSEAEVNDRNIDFSNMDGFLSRIAGPAAQKPTPTRRSME